MDHHAYSDAYGFTQPYLYGYWNEHAHGDQDGITNTYPQPFAHVDANGQPYKYAFADSNAYASLSGL